MKSKDRGFTLIELLVVMAIIGLLSSTVLASISSARSKARDARRLSDVKQIMLALELYRESNNGMYPKGVYTNSSASSPIDWEAGYLGVALEPYLPTMPQDPLDGTGTAGASYPVADNHNYYAYYSYPDNASNPGTGYALMFRLENTNTTLDATDGVRIMYAGFCRWWDHTGAVPSIPTQGVDASFGVQTNDGRTITMGSSGC